MFKSLCQSSILVFTNYQIQDSIPVGCIPPTRKPMCLSFSCHHQMLLQGVGVGLQMNKFEKVPSDHHQMSLAGVGHQV